MKTCSRCKKQKPKEEFSKAKCSSDGFAHWCKKCHKEYRRENKEKLIEWARKYRQKNPEKMLKYQREYHRKNKDRIIRWRKKHYQEHREKILEDRKKYYQEHKEERTKYRRENRERIAKWEKTDEHKEKHREYYQKNKKRLAKHQRRYYQENKKKLTKKQREYGRTPAAKICRAGQQARRRAAIRNCEINDLELEQLKLLSKKTIRCAICKKRFTKTRRKTLDHILSLSKGGNNSLMNSQIICQSCNSKKHAKHYTEFNDGQFLMFLGSFAKN